MAVIAVVLFIAGCNGGEEGDDVGGRPGSSKGGPVTARPADATTKTRCDVGGRPDYFVPKPGDSALAVIGCARLGVSTKAVEFSANAELIARKQHVCLNPAYRGRGRLGTYIPAACVRDPVSRRLDVVGVEVPRQGVRGYQLVIWGTATPSTRQVVARYEGGETEAAVFTVPRPMARAAGATRAFSVFVVELYPEAACQRVRVSAPGTSPPRTSLIGPRPRLCPSR